MNIFDELKEQLEQNIYDDKTLDLLRRSLLKLYNESQESGTTQEFLDSLYNSVTCEGYKEGNTYRFVFSELLPKRKIESGWKTVYTLMINSFKRALEQAISNLEVVEYNERVVVCIIHHFSNTLLDYDNIETKGIIDTLNLFFLKDDSPEYIALHFDYVKDTIDYTEILLIPEKDFHKEK